MSDMVTYAPLVVARDVATNYVASGDLSNVHLLSMFSNVLN